MKKRLLIVSAVTLSALAVSGTQAANAQGPQTDNNSLPSAVAPPRPYSHVLHDSTLPPEGAPPSGEGSDRQFGGSGADNNSGRQEHRQKMMQRFDTNHDGVFDDSERAQMKEVMEQRRKEREARFDTNHDGQLDDSERAQMREFMQQRRMQKSNNGSGEQP